MNDTTNPAAALRRIATEAAFEVLDDVFSNANAHYKVEIIIDEGNNVTIKYSDMDEGWCDELRAALKISAAPQVEEVPAVPTVDEFLVRLLPPPGYEGHKVIARDGKLMFCLPGDVLPTDGLCFYDGDMRSVVAPERIQPSIADDKEFCALLQDYVVQKAHVCEAQKVARIRLFANIDAKLTQARDTRNGGCRVPVAERDEWKAKFTAAEEKLASIRAALDKE